MPWPRARALEVLPSAAFPGGKLSDIKYLRYTCAKTCQDWRECEAIPDLFCVSWRDEGRAFGIGERVALPTVVGVPQPPAALVADAGAAEDPDTTASIADELRSCGILVHVALLAIVGVPQPHLALFADASAAQHPDATAAIADELRLLWVLVHVVLAVLRRMPQSPDALLTDAGATEGPYPTTTVAHNSRAFGIGKHVALLMGSDPPQPPHAVSLAVHPESLQLLHSLANISGRLQNHRLSYDRCRKRHIGRVRWQRTAQLLEAILADRVPTWQCHNR